MTQRDTSLDAEKIGLKSELEFLRSLAEILAPLDGGAPDVRRALLAISTMRVALSGAPRVPPSATAAVDPLELLRAELKLDENGDNACGVEPGPGWENGYCAGLRTAYRTIKNAAPQAVADVKARRAIDARQSAVAAPVAISGGIDQALLDRASWEIQRHLGREGSLWGISACEEVARIALVSYGIPSGAGDTEWLEDQLIEVMRLASRGLWAPDKDDGITDTLRLHGIRLLVDGQEERYEALLNRVKARRATEEGKA